MGVRLSRIDEDDQVGGHGRVKKDGTFEIKGVNDGDYAIAVWGLQNNWYVKSVRLGGQELLEKGLQLEKGGSGGRLEVIVSAASAQMEGSVSESDGAVIGAHVRIAPEPETLSFAQRQDRPERPFLGYWYGTGHLSCSCEVSSITGKRFSPVGPTNRHAVRG